MDAMGALDGLLAPEMRLLVDAALRAYMDKDLQANETRTTPQRRADALGDICQVALAQLPDGSAKRNPPHLQLTVDLGMLEGRCPEDLLVAIHNEAADGPLSVATLRRLACDARISRVITDGPSIVLDVGRTMRTVPPAIWRALVARDGGCVKPGCDRGPEDCQAHHLHHWPDGGGTELDNLQLVCRHHHRDTHHHDRRGPSP
jgi:hypothetical protein